MSWLFGRRSNGDEESDSDEYTDASASDDEYTSSSEEEDITDEKEDSDESAKAIELSLEDSPPRTSEAGVNGVKDETNDQRPGTAIIESNDSHRAEISEEEHANESRDDNLPFVESSGDAAISDTGILNAKSVEEESGANVRAEEERLTATRPALVIDTDIIVSDNGDSINSSRLAKVANRTAKKPANEDEELGPEFYKDLPTKENCETKEEKVIAPTAGQEVHVNNAEADTGRSTLTNDVDQDEGKIENDENASENNEEEEELEEVTSIHEKRSLLVLAAEHDRVDILKAILADGAEDRATLLNSNIPPLHISIAYGSSNAVQSLLRMGADPSVRPDVSKIKAAAEAAGEEKLVDIPNMGRFDNLSAWELAFGKTTDTDGEKPALKKKSSWFGGGSKTSIEIAPSKLEGIRHAFTAEGLRCIGSDESDRLKSLLDSGMPSTIDIGGKHLYDWSVEMGALKCEELLRPDVAARSANTAISCEGDTTEQQKYQEYPTTGTDPAEIPAVCKRSKPGEDSLSELVNRIDELESLAKALSSCLDNLAEEVSVCHGLLLMGGGASALASHVRSLKNLKENKSAELDRLEEAWENSEDELAYWVKESGALDREIAELMSPALFSSSVSNHALFEGSPEEEHFHKQQLKAQALLLDNKIRKLRASITDLSEENTRDLEEVERRGLSGGIKLVRSLREELREMEFTLNETKSAEALCRAKIKLIQSRITHKKATGSVSVGAGDSNISTNKTNSVNHRVTHSQGISATHSEALPQTEGAKSAPKEEPTTSEKIATGKSNAIALQNHHTQGYFTVDLWRILLRIIGLGSGMHMQGAGNAGSGVMIV